MFKVGDEVTVNLGKTKEILFEGVIASINEYREPHQKYAISIDVFDDFVFVGEDRITNKKLAKPVGSASQDYEGVHQPNFGNIDRIKALQNYTTAELVDHLSRREGVIATVVVPPTNGHLITVNGPATVMIVID